MIILASALAFLDFEGEGVLSGALAMLFLFMVAMFVVLAEAGILSWLKWGGFLRSLIASVLMNALSVAVNLLLFTQMSQETYNVLALERWYLAVLLLIAVSTTIEALALLSLDRWKTAKAGRAFGASLVANVVSYSVIVLTVILLYRVLA